MGCRSAIAGLSPAVKFFAFVLQTTVMGKQVPGSDPSVSRKKHKAKVQESSEDQSTHPVSVAPMDEPTVEPAVETASKKKRKRDTEATAPETDDVEAHEKAERKRLKREAKEAKRLIRAAEVCCRTFLRRVAHTNPSRLPKLMQQRPA